MAVIIFGKSTCSLCNDLLHEGEDILTTPSFPIPFLSPLWRQVDSGMHYGCFQSWDLRAEFVAAYNSCFDPMPVKNGVRTVMQLDGRVIRYRVNESPLAGT